MLFNRASIAAAALFVSAAVQAKTEVNAYHGKNCVGTPVLTQVLATIGQCFEIASPTPAPGFESLQFFTNGEVQCFQWFTDFGCQDLVALTTQQSNDCVNPIDAFDAFSVKRVSC